MNLLERLAPRWHLSRQVARMQAAEVEIAMLQLEQHRHRVQERFGYEGAVRSDRTAGWLAPSTSADTEIRGGLDRLRNRMRALYRDNAWVKKGCRVWTSSTIRDGIVCNAEDDRAQALFDRWAVNSTECDPKRRTNIYGKQRESQLSTVQSGEALIRRRRRRLTDGLTVPLQLEVIEADYLDTHRDEDLPNGGAIIQGIEFGPIGDVRAYHLFRDHPGNFRTADLSTTRVPARDIIHLFRGDRPGQTRGVPWGASIIVPVKDLQDGKVSESVRRKVASCFTGFVHDIETPSDAAVNLVPGSDPMKPVGRLSPGQLIGLPPGKSITFARPPEAVGFKEFMEVGLHEVAVGMEVPYEALSGDLAGVSFSSGRIGRLDFLDEVQSYVQLEFIPVWCWRVWEWFIDAAILAGELQEPSAANWQAKPPRMIEPGREVAAKIRSMAAGLTSLQHEIRSLGEDPTRTYDEIAADQEALRERGIQLASNVPGSPGGTGVDRQPGPG